ncbi:MAG: hypothetical protein WAS27_01280 [Candidatus Saccharimonadales bacterium]
MNTFAIIRRTAWGILLGSCVAVSVLYLALSQTLLTKSGLQTIVIESHLATSVQQDILLPKVLASTHQATHAHLLSDAKVTEIFTRVVSTERLNRLLEPAIDVSWRWLNSKEPSIEFTIPLTPLSQEFTTELAKHADPRVRTIMTREVALGEHVTLTPVSTGVRVLTNSSLSDLPSYLNMLYAVSLVTAAIAILVGVWLLIKHRFAGVITIGAAAIGSAIGLYIISVSIGTRIGTLSPNPQLQLVARSGLTLFENTLHSYLFMLVGGGILMVALGGAGLYAWTKRHAHASMTLTNRN